MYDNITSTYNFNSLNSPPCLSKSIMITPYEKVLTILNNVKQYINSTSKRQSKLVRSLDWVIKVITSHSLYAYELKEKDLISKLSKENKNFKQFVDFVSEYNEQVIEMNKKNVFWGARTIDYANELLQKPSIKLRKQLNNSKRHHTPTKSEKKIKFVKASDKNENNSILKNKKSKKDSESIIINNNSKTKNEKYNTITSKIGKKMNCFNKSGKNLRNMNKINISGKILYPENILKKKSEIIKQPRTFFIDINKLDTPRKIENDVINSSINKDSNKHLTRCVTNSTMLNTSSNKDLKKSLTKSCVLNTSSNNNLNKYLNNSSQNSTTSKKKDDSYYIINDENLDNFNFKDLRKIRKSVKINKARLDLKFNSNFNTISLLNLQGELNEANFNVKLIMEKEFNIFELEKIVGHKNVLPIMGRTMLDSFGLIDEKIMPIDKLDPFLISVTNQYLTSTLYHNSLHGADITQTICLFFNNSNAEEVCHAQVIDLLSIIIAALGHDIGHPGLTNTFQINSSSDMAITYNDSSCLENFHLSTLFKTIRKDEYNIFEKLSTQDYKNIRKKMISEILATDMAIHGKVLNNIRSKIPEHLLTNEKENNKNKIKKFELITDINNEQTTNEEKQALFDYFIHSADLGHNTKIFKISLKWVKLLSEEFWLQGDKERKMNLNISFLCDRDTTIVPKSQVGFIGGFIIPTYNFLVIMFPNLSYTIENAKDNLNKWQKLADEGRKKGWSPEKKKEEDSNENEKKMKNEKNNQEKTIRKKANVVEIKID